MNDADFAAFLTKCDSLGIKNILSFYNAVNVPFIDTFKSYPSLFSWAIADDGDTRYTVAEIVSRHNAVRAADPNHVTSTALTTGIFQSPYRLRQYTAATDVPMLEWYPVYENDGDLGSTKYGYDPLNRFDKASTEQGKSDIAIVQTFNWKVIYPDKPYVFPSAAQVRATSYAALAAGSKGVLYYTFKDYTNNSTVNLSQPAMWNATVDFAAKMKSTLSPVVLSGAPTHLQEQNNTDYVHASYWSYQGQQYLIVVNLNAASTSGGSETGQRTVSFATGLAGTMTPLFSDYPATLKKTAAGTVSGVLQPLEVQVYKVGPA